MSIGLEFCISLVYSLLLQSSFFLAVQSNLPWFRLLGMMYLYHLSKYEDFDLAN